MSVLIETPPTISGNAAVFKLSTGETVSVQLMETGLGIYGYSLKVVAERGMILLRPSSNNAVDIFTQRSLAAMEIEQVRVVAARTLERSRKNDPV